MYMFRSLFVPLDGSPFAEQALPWALSIARRAGASLHLVRVHVLYILQEPVRAWVPHGPGREASWREQEQLYLDATAKWLTAVSPVPVSTAVVGGEEADGLLGRAREAGADLVVMTTHGRGPVGRFFLGSVADELIRRGGVPVLLARPHEPAPDVLPEPAPENLLIPLDGSALAERALGPAADLARLTEGRCNLLRVVESPDRPAAEAREYLERIAGRLREQGLQVGTRVVVSPQAAEAILEEAGAQGSDLIALGTHGRGGVRRMLLGSIADKVIRGCSLPVLVCPPPR
jgi:nucleotide-binding universal stress UspA family protein